MLRKAAAVLALAAIAALSHWLSTPAPESPAQRGAVRKQTDKLPNVLLKTQHGNAVRFYDDLVRDRTVLINLMYTGCGDICPANTAQLAALHERLGARVGSDIALLSVSIDPAGDSPERLERYWRAFGARPGWLFVTGAPADVERLRRALGLYDLDPDIDDDPAQHSGMLVIGNDRSDKWLTLPVMTETDLLAVAVLRVAAQRAGIAGQGREPYTRFCATCHGGKGDGDGPLARALVPPPARHSDAAYMARLSDDYVLRLLREGGAAFGKSPLMAPWGRNLSEEQLLDIIAFMRTLAR
jgi:protein SCO1/2